MPDNGGYYGAANQWFNQGPGTFFPGSAVAGFTPAQTNAWDMMRGGAAQTAGAANDIWGSYANQLSGFDPSQNPWLDQAVGAMRQNAQQQYDRQVQPAINQQAIAGGAFGGSRHGVTQAIAMNDLNQNMLNTEAQMRNNAYGQGLNYMSNMYGMAPGMLRGAATAWAMPGTTEAAIGAQQQGQNQAVLTEEQNRWNYNRDAAQNHIMNYGQMLGQIPYGNMTGYLPPTPNPITSGIGAASAGYSFANQFGDMWGGGGGGEAAGEFGYPVTTPSYGGWGY